MNSDTDFSGALVLVLQEAFFGREQGSVFLDDGEPGVIPLLDDLTAAEAGREVFGYSVATHARHVWHSLEAYRLAVMLNDPIVLAESWPEWGNFFPSATEWAELRKSLQERTLSFLENMGKKRDQSGRKVEFALAAVAHIAFHLGVIRSKYDVLKVCA